MVVRGGRQLEIMDKIEIILLIILCVIALALFVGVVLPIFIALGKYFWNVALA